MWSPTRCRPCMRPSSSPIPSCIAPSTGRAMALMRDASPRMMDRYLATQGVSQQRSNRPARDIGNDNLFDFAEDGRERGGYRGHVMERSFYGVVARNPVFSLLAAVGMGAAFALGARGRRRAADSRRAADESDVEVGERSTYGIADITPDRGPEAVVRGDTSIADSLATGELRPAASPRVREQTMARPLVAPLADVR